LAMQLDARNSSALIQLGRPAGATGNFGLRVVETFEPLLEASTMRH
jgi:hypothetical protein